MAEKIYVISNSHLDPVWIWERRSGRTAWINTLHSVIKRMEDHPYLKFTCSSAAHYRWIEENEPGLFRKIAKHIENGRWEVVGGWEVQSDAIIARHETLLRQGFSGKEYFRKKFGIDVNIGYCVDSFGHAAGLPKMLNAAGIDHYVAMRPNCGQMVLPLLFDWKADDDSMVRFLRIFDFYDLGNQTKEQYMKRIESHWNSPLKYQTMFFGIGDHGGGIYEKHLQWVKEASEKYDIVYATLGEYFAMTDKDKVPEVTGELGNVFRGCYSACHEVKRSIACSLDRLLTAEKLGIPASELKEPWKELLFNHFHDILPGTSIRTAYEKDVYPGIGSVAHTANYLIDGALCRRAAAKNTTFMPEGGVMIRNTEPYKVKKLISVTGFADPNESGSIFNCFKDKDGGTLPLQLLPPPTTFGPCHVAWGDLSTVVELGPHEEKFLAYSKTSAFDDPNFIGFDRQEKVLEKLGFQLFHDDHGTWGFSMGKNLHADDEAVLEKTEKIADGPAASILRATYRLRSSKIVADLTAFSGISEIKIALKINYQEPDSCLKMTYAHRIPRHDFATGSAAGSVLRLENVKGEMPDFLNGSFRTYPPVTCEVPMIDWCAAYSPESGSSAAFYSATHHGCDHAEGKLRITLLRAVLFADHHPFPKNIQSGYQEIGYSFTEVYLSEESDANLNNLPVRAHKCLAQPEVLEITAHEADPDAFPGAESCPLINELPHVVVDAMLKNDSGKWEIHLINYGDDCELPLPSGEKMFIPGKKAVQFEL